MSQRPCYRLRNVTVLTVAFVVFTVGALLLMGWTMLSRWSYAEKSISEAVARFNAVESARVSADLERAPRSFLARQAMDVAAVMAAQVAHHEHTDRASLSDCLVCDNWIADRQKTGQLTFSVNANSGTVSDVVGAAKDALPSDVDGWAEMGVDLSALLTGSGAQVLIYQRSAGDADPQRHYLALAPVHATTADGRYLLAGLSMPVEDAMRESRLVQSSTDRMGREVAAILTNASADMRKEVGRSLAIIMSATTFLLGLNGWITLRNSRLLARSEQWHRGLLANALVGMLVHKRGRIRFVNQRMAEMLESEPDKLIGTPALGWVHPDFHEMIKCNVHTPREDDNPPEYYDASIVTATGKERWMNLWIRDLAVGPDNDVLITAVDITERKKAEHQLQLSEQKFRTFTEQAQHPMCVIQDQKMVYCNSALAEQVGLVRSEDGSGMSLRQIVHGDDWLEVAALLQKMIAGKSETERIVTRFVTTKNEVRWHEVQFARIEYEDRAAVLADSQDVTEIRKLMQQLDSERLRDSLTGLHNRRYFTERFLHMEESGERRRQDLTLLMLDVDGFKMTNDTFGHAVGDRVLQAVADVLRDQVRDEDIALRFGGDEFVVVMRSVSAAEAEATVKRINEELSVHLLSLALEESTFSEDLCTMVGLSGGAATYGPEGYDSIEEALRVADERMYRHKQQNKWRRHGVFPGSIGRTRKIG